MGARLVTFCLKKHDICVTYSTDDCHSKAISDTSFTPKLKII